jgi:hypothetical protein
MPRRHSSRPGAGFRLRVAVFVRFYDLSFYHYQPDDVIDADSPDHTVHRFPHWVGTITTLRHDWAARAIPLGCVYWPKRGGHHAAAS